TYAPYGYMKDPENKNHLIIDQEVAPIIRRIFAYGAEGMAPMQIAYKLTAEQIPTPSVVIGNKHSRRNEFTRKDWSAHVVRRMLRNELYIGNLISGRSKKLSYKSRKVVQVSKENWIINKNTHEPIVSQEIFDMAQLHLDNRQITRERVHNPLLKGMVTCKECGKKLSIMASKDRKGNTILYFRCNTYASSPLSRYCTPHNNNIDKLTEVVVNKIKETCLKYIDEKKLKNVAKEKTMNKNKQEENKLKRELLERQLKNIETKIDSIYDDKLNGIIAQNDFKRMYDGYVNQRIQIERQIQDFKNQKEEIEDRLDLDKIVKDFISMNNITSTIITMLVSKIEITQNKEVYIHYRFKELQKSAS
ncbi:MAG: recombinase family protein, partial [Clostridia bacterium]|nr:recombinase family protein [Clostridia bacterium]